MAKKSESASASPLPKIPQLPPSLSGEILSPGKNAFPLHSKSKGPSFKLGSIFSNSHESPLVSSVESSSSESSVDVVGVGGGGSAGGGGGIGGSSSPQPTDRTAKRENDNNAIIIPRFINVFIKYVFLNFIQV